MKTLLAICLLLTGCNTTTPQLVCFAASALAISGILLTIYVTIGNHIACKRYKKGNWPESFKTNQND